MSRGCTRPPILCQQGTLEQHQIGAGLEKAGQRRPPLVPAKRDLGSRASPPTSLPNPWATRHRHSPHGSSVMRGSVGRTGANGSPPVTNNARAGVQDAIRKRHHHHSTMASYEHARALVHHARTTGQEPYFCQLVLRQRRTHASDGVPTRKPTLRDPLGQEAPTFQKNRCRPTAQGPDAPSPQGRRTAPAHDPHSTS
jgi:hypothetical protein